MKTEDDSSSSLILRGQATCQTPRTKTPNCRKTHTHTHNSQLCSLKACMSHDPRWRVDGGRDGDGQGYRVC